MKRSIPFLLLLGLAVIWGSCKKEVVMPTLGSINFSIAYSIDGNALEINNVKYTNQAGNNYSVTKLNYYISGVVLTKSDGSLFKSKKVFYQDAANASSNKFTIDSIPVGKYTGITFYLGLDSLNNMSGKLPVNADNTGMLTNDAQYGAYHFLKLEGNYLDTGLVSHEYKMHLVKNKNLVKCSLPYAVDLKYKNQSCKFEMNIGELFKNPQTIDLNTDGAMSMDSDALLDKLKKNAADVFQLKN